MKIVENKELNNVAITKMSIDDTSDLPFIPASHHIWCGNHQPCIYI